MPSFIYPLSFLNLPSRYFLLLAYSLFILYLLFIYPLLTHENSVLTLWGHLFCIHVEQ